MHKELLTIVALALAPIPVIACETEEVTNLTIDMTVNAYSTLIATPGFETATGFFDMLPSTFCDFDRQYGHNGTRGGVFYDVDLFSALLHLSAFIDRNDLSTKYVSLAAESRWDVDNVNALQHHYRNLFLTDPSIVIADIWDLPKADQRTAVRFLFDGHYPTDNFLNVSLKTEICEIDSAFCSLLLSVEDELAAQTR